MSRGQSTQAFNTASNENAADFGNAQSAFGNTEDAIGNYNNQLSKFVSGNPYAAGGEYDQTINTGLSNVSDAGANSLAGALQAQARRPLRQPQCEPSDYTEVRRGMIPPRAALVLAEAHVQLPMQVVLKAPVAPNRSGELLR